MSVETFVGTSGRVFPKDDTAKSILKKWLDKLQSFSHFELLLKTKLIDLQDEQIAVIEQNGEQRTLSYDSLILCTGGKSWKRTGSDGEWAKLFQKLEIPVKEFNPMNCGFNLSWSNYFKEHVDRHPLKNISVTYQKNLVRGECMLTPFGIEGGALYALSYEIVRDLLAAKEAIIEIDLKPDLSEEKIIELVAQRKNKETLSNFFRKKLKLDKKVLILIKELCPDKDLNDAKTLARCLKKLKFELESARDIEEAISSSGGVEWSALNSNLSLKQYPQIYLAGEMLDWSAPTGGYLLQGCFSTSYRVIQSLINEA